MTIKAHFDHSLTAATNLTAMYVELRRHRQLGARGRLPPGHEDLLWLPRSAVVAAISALDAYVHAVLYDRLPHALRSQVVPDPLCDALAGIIPIKNAGGFRAALPVLLANDSVLELVTQLKDQSLAFASYQAPEKIISAYAMLGQNNIFDSVAGLWPGPNSTAQDLRRVLANYVRRRNQIAHEGDRENNGNVRHMQPQYANDCAIFIDNLVTRLHRIIYPAENT